MGIERLHAVCVAYNNVFAVGFSLFNMIGQVRFAGQNYVNARIGFKATPQEVADKFKKVDLLEPDEVGDFNIETKKESTSTLGRAADLLEKTHPDHARILRQRAEQKK